MLNNMCHVFFLEPFTKSGIYRSVHCGIIIPVLLRILKYIANTNQLKICGHINIQCNNIFLENEGVILVDLLERGSTIHKSLVKLFRKYGRLNTKTSIGEMGKCC